MTRVGFKPVSIGEFRLPINFQRFAHIIDEYSFNQLNCTTIATPRAKVEFDDRLIRQVLRDDGVDTTTVMMFTIRYIPNITTKDRIIFKDEEYEIYAKQDLGARERFLLIWGRKIEPTN